jgi:hypothetical protein
MARTPLVPRALTVNGSSNGATGATTIDATLVSNGSIINNAIPEQIILRVTHTDGTPHDIMIRKGVNPPAVAAGQGDLVVEVAATSGVVYIGPLESGRFLQSDGSIHIDYESGFAGTIDAIFIPRA